MSDQTPKEGNSAFEHVPNLDMYLDAMAMRRAMIINAQNRTDSEETCPTATELTKMEMRLDIMQHRKWMAFLESASNKLPYLANVSITGCLPFGAVVIATDEEHARELVMDKIFSSKMELKAMGTEVPINENDISIRITPLDFGESCIWLGKID